MKNNNKNKSLVEVALGVSDIKNKIYIIRGQKVMLDRDLAELYGVPTGVLNQAVKRNIKRFPEDFMFKLTKEETKNWMSQIVTSNLRSQFVILKKSDLLRSQIATLKTGSGKHAKYAPVAFTEQGIAMLSSVLHSDRAIAVNIQIIRIFTKLREMIDAYKELREKVEEMEKSNEINFEKIFEIIRFLTREEKKPKNIIGFKTK